MIPPRILCPEGNLLLAIYPRVPWSGISRGWGFAGHPFSDQDVDLGVLSKYVRCGADVLAHRYHYQPRPDEKLFTDVIGCDWERLLCLVTYVRMVEVRFCLVFFLCII